MSTDISYGLVLGGGGAKGSYQLGVWQALVELQIHIKKILGVSIGSINGALFATKNLDFAEKLWSSVDVEQLFSLGVSADDSRNQNIILDFHYKLQKIINQRGIDMEPLRKLLRDSLSEEELRTSKIAYALLTCALPTFKPITLALEEMPDGKLFDYILASSCFPAFRPQKIGKNTFVDGGLYDNVPIGQMAKSGLRQIIAVDLSTMGFHQYYPLDEPDDKLIYIKTSFDLGSFFSNTPEQVIINKKAGYLDTKKAFNKLFGAVFFFEPLVSVCDFLSSAEAKLDFFSRVDIITNKDWNSSLATLLIKQIAINTDTRFGKQAFLFALLEITGLCLNISRYEIFTYDSFLEAICEEFKHIASSSEFITISKVLINKSAKRFSKLVLNYSPKLLPVYIFHYLIDKPLHLQLVARLFPEATLAALTLHFINIKESCF